MKCGNALPLILVVMASAASHADDVDGRQIVEMPPEARAALRAEKQLGLSTMGRHRNAPPNARPGMFMPDEMHAIGRSLHAASSNFATVAADGDTTKALSSLQAVTATCVACHGSFRVQ